MTGEPTSDAPETGSEPSPGADPAIPQVPEPADLPPVPEDADDTRGHHLRRLLRHPVTLIVGAIVVAIAFAAGLVAAGAAIGAAAAGVAILLTLLVVWLLASGKAQDDFYRAYGEGRGLTRISGKSDLPPVTPLLRKGDRRYAQQRFNGVLPGGVDGSLCLYTYEEENARLRRQRADHLRQLHAGDDAATGTTPFMQELFCQRRFGFRFMDSMEDVFRKRQRVEHESEAVDKKFEIFMGPGDDLNRARQILSPTFLVWLENHSPEAYAFELVGGSLVCNVKGHKKSASELDILCTASAAVARRLQEEATELSGTCRHRTRPSPSQNGSASVLEGGDRPVGRGRPQRLHVVLARGDAHDADPGAVPRLDVARGVADRDRAGPVERVARDPGRAVERLAADVDARVRVRAVAAEAEVAVQVGPGELRVRGGLGVAGDQPDQPILVGQPAEEVGHPRHHPVPRRVLDLLAEVALSQRHELRHLVAHRLAAERPAKALEADLGVGDALARVVGDVDRDVVELEERPVPGAVRGAAGVDQGPIDVEEQGWDPRVSHGSGAHGSGGSARWWSCRGRARRRPGARG